MTVRRTEQAEAAKAAGEPGTGTTQRPRKEPPTAKPPEGRVVVLPPEQAFEFHDATKSIPIRKCDVDSLVKSIREYGQFIPITVYDGKVIAGRSRYMACRELAIACNAVELEDLGGKTATEWVLAELRESDKMRHLTDSLLALVAARNIPDHYAPAAEKRMKDGGAPPDGDVTGTASSLCAWHSNQSSW